MYETCTNKEYGNVKYIMEDCPQFSITRQQKKTRFREKYNPRDTFWLYTFEAIIGKAFH